MANCEVCGINLEPDFNDEDGVVCAQCKAQANYTRTSGGRWRCNDCGAAGPTVDKVIHHNICYPDGPAKVLLRGAGAVLTNADVDVLDGSINRQVRVDNDTDNEVHRLYRMWKSL